MGKKYIPSEEELNNILNIYYNSKNYSETSRQTGLSTATIKRIVLENAGKQVNIPKNIVQYEFLPPVEPISKIEYNYSIVAKKLYEEISENGLL